MSTIVLRRGALGSSSKEADTFQGRRGGQVTSITLELEVNLWSLGGVEE